MTRDGSLAASHPSDARTTVATAVLMMADDLATVGIVHLMRRRQLIPTAIGYRDAESRLTQGRPRSREARHLRGRLRGTRRLPFFPYSRLRSFQRMAVTIHSPSAPAMTNPPVASDP